MTSPKPRAGGKVKAWAYKSDKHGILAFTVWPTIGTVKEQAKRFHSKTQDPGHIVRVEIRELHAVKSRGRKSK